MTDVDPAPGVDHHTLNGAESEKNISSIVPTEPNLVKVPTHIEIERLDLPTSAADGLIQQPFGLALEESRPESVPALTDDQKAKYKEILKTASSWTEIPTKQAKGAPKAPITDDERMWLSQECLLRYLRASKWNLKQAIERLLDTLAWRRDYGVDDLTGDYISPEQETGKLEILGWDIHGRPCLYLNPGRQNTKKSEKQIQHLVFMLERAIDLLPPGQENLALICNFKDSNYSSSPSAKQAQQTLYILQNHSPERLGRALCINSTFTPNKQNIHP